MTLPLKRVGSQAARQIGQHRTQQICYRRRAQFSPFQRQPSRSFALTPRWSADDEAKSTETKEPESDLAPYFNEAFFESLPDKDAESYRNLPPDERRKMEKVKARFDQDFAPGSKMSNDMQKAIEDAAAEIEQEIGPEVVERGPKEPESFWNMGEEADAGMEEEFEGDDISSLGHAYLEEHRDLRQMARVVAWEMPMLSKLTHEFEPPDPIKQPLRWRYTTYMGSHHPASRKVVVEFCPDHIVGLTEAQKLKLKKLAGARYNPVKTRSRYPLSPFHHDFEDTIKMSCESFETQAQNKRFLADTIQKLIAECKDPNADTFEDVPLDVRHVKRKKTYPFPDEWKLTPRRLRELEQKRKESAVAYLPEPQERLVDAEDVRTAKELGLDIEDDPVMVPATPPRTKPSA